MAEFPSVTVDLSEQLEFPGDSYPLTGKVDVATYTVGEKEYQLQDGIDYDVVFTNAGTGVLLTGMVRAHATGECDRCLEPASFDIAGETKSVSVQIAQDELECRFDEQTYVVSGYRLPNQGMRINIDGRVSEVAVLEHAGVLSIFEGTSRFQLIRHDPIAGAEQSDGGGRLTAPMPGKIIAVQIAAGDTVEKGDALLTLEAMKMEHTINAPVSGTIDKVFFAQGDQVDDGAELVSFVQEG